MTFCTAINCIDGRTQLPVIDHLKRRFSVKYVDMITEPGPVAVLSSDPDSSTSVSIFRRVDISMSAHNSTAIAIVAHHDCAGNPVDESEQRQQLETCLRILKKKYRDAEVIGLWVDQSWWVSEVKSGK